jgi:hypothetical protein
LLPELLPEIRPLKVYQQPFHAGLLARRFGIVFKWKKGVEMPISRRQEVERKFRWLRMAIAVYLICSAPIGEAFMDDNTRAVYAFVNASSEPTSLIISIEGSRVDQDLGKDFSDFHLMLWLCCVDIDEDDAWGVC